MKELVNIQSKLKAPKSQRNNFGNYNYRSCEDILEAVKPLLAESKCHLVINDHIELIGERYYIKAVATITNQEGVHMSSTAYAREPESKKGNDVSQITGAASSYARKYALNALFAIDDTKDADSTNNHKEEEVSDIEIKRMEDTIKEKGINKDKFVAYLGKDLCQLTRKEFNKARKLIDNYGGKVNG